MDKKIANNCAKIAKIKLDGSNFWSYYHQVSVAGEMYSGQAK